ncbi:hypothetical protein FB451DRAFT_1226153 [Mycena latifolia]|nr:hypothetical protein FB451DRAFT_1226153 [Mycena latifolia]
MASVLDHGPSTTSAIQALEFWTSSRQSRQESSRLVRHYDSNARRPPPPALLMAQSRWLSTCLPTHSHGLCGSLEDGEEDISCHIYLSDETSLCLGNGTQKEDFDCVLSRSRTKTGKLIMVPIMYYVAAHDSNVAIDLRIRYPGGRDAQR